MSEAPVLCIKKGQLVGNLKLACLTNLVLFIRSFFLRNLGLGTTRNSWKNPPVGKLRWPGDEQLFWRESTGKMDIPYILEGVYFQRTKDDPNNPKSVPIKSKADQAPAPLWRTRRTPEDRRGGCGDPVWDWCVFGGQWALRLPVGFWSAGKIPPNTKGVGKKVKNLWTSKKPWERNSPPKMVIVPNWTMSIVGVVTQNTFTPQPGLDSEAASCLARDTSTAGLMLWLVLSL